MSDALPQWDCGSLNCQLVRGYSATRQSSAGTHSPDTASDSCLAAAEGAEVMDETVMQGEAGFAERPLWSKPLLARALAFRAVGSHLSRDGRPIGVARKVERWPLLEETVANLTRELTASPRYLRRRDPMETFASTIWVWISVTSRRLLMRSCLC